VHGSLVAIGMTMWFQLPAAGDISAPFKVLELLLQAFQAPGGHYSREVKHWLVIADDDRLLSVGSHTAR
jgi:hypothetical protein